MQKDQHKTDVIFRVDTTKDWKGTIFALFPHDVADHKGSVTSYQHIGQHSSADYHHSIRTSKLAKPNEYKDLNIDKKQNYTKYLKSYNNTKN